MSGRSRITALAVAGGLLAAFATAASATPRENVDNPKLAAITVAEIRTRLPPASSTVQLVPLSKGGFAGLVDATDKALRSAGYAVASQQATAPTAHVVHIDATPLWDGYVLHLQFGQEGTTRFYRPDQTGALVPAGPASVREIHQ